MKITEIEIFPVTIPFSGGFASSLGTATGTWEICKFVVVKVHTDEGITGYGEVPPWLRVGKESQSSIIPIIQNYLASELIGEDPFNIAKIWVKMDAAAPGNTMAKTPLDLAFYDIMGKAMGVPVYKLLGGRVQDKIPLTGLVGFGELDEMMTYTEMWVKKGYQTVRLKIGMGIKEDETLLRIARNTIGDEIKIRVDANQAYRSKEAIRVIKTLEKYNLELVEQPVAWWDVVGLSEVRKAVDIPIMPHESLYNIIDAKRLVEMRAVDLFGLKLDRPGGITNAKIAYHLAELHNIPCTVISSIELGISTSASMQFAATFKSLEFACEASGPVIISDDVVKQQVKIQNGFAEIPTGQGLGVELDEQKLSKYCEEVISCN